MFWHHNWHDSIRRFDHSSCNIVHFHWKLHEDVGVNSLSSCVENDLKCEEVNFGTTCSAMYFSFGPIKLMKWSNSWKKSSWQFEFGVRKLLFYLQFMEPKLFLNSWYIWLVKKKWEVNIKNGAKFNLIIWICWKYFIIKKKDILDFICEMFWHWFQNPFFVFCFCKIKVCLRNWNVLKIFSMFLDI